MSFNIKLKKESIFVQLEYWRRNYFKIYCILFINIRHRAFYFIFDILIFRAKRCLSERFSNSASFQKSYVYCKICFRCTISLSFILQKKKWKKFSETYKKIHQLFVIWKILFSHKNMKNFVNKQTWIILILNTFCSTKVRIKLA